MLKAGNEYTEKITDCTALGSGIAKVDGCAVFVRGALTGETCRFKITEAKKKYAHAVPIETLEISDERREIDCPIFESCGGCTLRHVSANFECDIKRNCVLNAFRSLGISHDIVKETALPSSELRNGVHIHISPNGDFGFFEENSNTVCCFPSDGCRIIPNEFYEIAKSVAQRMSECGILTSELFLRQSTAGNIALCITLKNSFVDEAFAKYIVKEHTDISGVAFRQSEKNNYRTVHGVSYIESTVAELQFRISPEAFFQVNYSGAELLFSKVLEYATRCEFSYCADLYCGTGVLGITAASHFPSARFVGVEINESAVADARFNAKLNSLTNIDFYCGDAAHFASENSPELVILDPPRRGLSKNMLNTVFSISPQNIIYVSCDPFTLARDCEKLVKSGYEISELSPIDMFPQSSHVETVALLSKQSQVPNN